MAVNTVSPLGRKQRLCGVRIGSTVYSLELQTKRVMPVPHIAIVSSHHLGPWQQGFLQHFVQGLNSFYDQELPAYHQLVIKPRQELVQQVLLKAHEERSLTHVITMGWWHTSEVALWRHVLNLSFTHLYCLPGSPAELTERYAQMTGVYSEPASSLSLVHAIRAMMPGRVHRACVVYDASEQSPWQKDFMQQQFDEIAGHLRAANVFVDAHHWSHASHNLAALEDRIEGIDVIITLRDPAVSVHHEALVQLSERYRIPLCASELDSVAAGAAFGFGNAASYYSASLVSLMLSDMCKEKAENVVPAVQISERPLLRFNQCALDAQGIRLKEEMRTLLDMKSIFDE